MKIMVIDKKKYLVKRIVHYKGDDTINLIPYNPDEYNKIVADIVSALKNTVDPEEALKQALASLEYEEILDIHKALIKKKQKPKSSKGCYEITIGKHSIPMIN